MTHPTSLLAEFVDGTLGAADRAKVETHLAACPACRLEIRRAREARNALASLPEVPVPVGVTAPVVRRVAPRRAGARHTAPPRAAAAGAGIPLLYRVGAAAVAAMVVGVIAFAALKPTTRSRPAEAALAVSPPPVVEMDTNGDYTSGELAALSEATAKALDPGARASHLTAEEQVPGPAPSPTPAPGYGSAEAAPEAPDLNRATGGGSLTSTPDTLPAPQAILRGCLVAAGATDNEATLIESFQAKYQGSPALFAVLTEASKTGAPTDRVVVWAFAKNNCDIIAFTQSLFPSMLPSPATQPPVPVP